MMRILWQIMRIPLQGCRRFCVSELSCDVGNRCTPMNQDGSVAMAEVIDAMTAQAGCSHQPSELFADSAFIEWIIAGVYEDPGWNFGPTVFKRTALTFDQ